MLIQRCTEANKFPGRIEFKNLNIMNSDDVERIRDYMMLKGIGCFDLVTCFSVTMWIHLNHGDAGLQHFLKTVSSLGHFVLLEPQTWNSYKSAVRRMNKSDCEPFEHFKGLTWRTDIEREINQYLEKNLNMTLIQNFGETEWKRCIALYKQASSTTVPK